MCVCVRVCELGMNEAATLFAVAFVEFVHRKYSCDLFLPLIQT